MSRTSDENKPLDHAAEQYLAYEWKRISGAIIQEVAIHSGPLLGLLAGVEVVDSARNGAVRAEVDRILQLCIGRNCQMAMAAKDVHPDRRALWQAANEVYPNLDGFTAELTKDKAVRGLKRGVSQRTALCVLLHSHLYRRRFQALSEFGHEFAHISEYKNKVWPTLRKISDELIREYVRQNEKIPPPSYRCSLTHFREIRTRIGERYWRDPHVGTLSLGKIEVYIRSNFIEREVTGVGEGDDEDESQFGITEKIWSSPPMQEVMLSRKLALPGCLEQLGPLKRKLLSLEGELDRTDVGQLATAQNIGLSHRDTRIAAFCTQQGIDRPAFEEMRSEALDELETCVEKNSRKE